MLTKNVKNNNKTTNALTIGDFPELEDDEEWEEDDENYIRKGRF